MKLYIVRHAIAVPHGTPGVAEDDRPLTEEGIRKMRQAAVGLFRLGYVPDLILTSPLIRATQTSEILIETFGKGTGLTVAPSLAPSGRRTELFSQIARQAKKTRRLMLVGHQPSLGEIAGEILWRAREHFIDLKKGGVCAIELASIQPELKGSLIALITPSILRRIALEIS
jgi:phosphohistidine phosphatase